MIGYGNSREKRHNPILGLTRFMFRKFVFTKYYDRESLESVHFLRAFFTSLYNVRNGCPLPTLFTIKNLNSIPKSLDEMTGDFPTSDPPWNLRHRRQTLSHWLRISLYTKKSFSRGNVFPPYGLKYYKKGTMSKETG